MPAKFEMSWEPKARRWWKMKDGKRYKISCRQLSKWCGKPVPETKEGSYQVANAWWEAKRAEIDGQEPAHPHEEAIAEQIRKRNWSTRQGDHEQADYHQILAQRLYDNPELPEFSDPIDLEFLQRVIGFPAARAWLIDKLTPKETWDERFKADGAVVVHAGRSVDEQVDAYLATQRSRMEARSLSVSEFDTIRRCVFMFRDWLGAGTPIDRIDADKIEGYWLHLDKSEKSVDYKKKLLLTARVFVEWLESKSLIPLPRNIRNRKHKFKKVERPIPTMTDDEAKLLIDNATGQLKLHLLLMLNCGFTQIDISELHPSEVKDDPKDKDYGRVIRKRTKTKEKENVPTVNYRLWPLTWELLLKYKSDSPNNYLLTSTGKPWLTDHMNGESRSHADKIVKRYNRLKERLKKQGIEIDKPVKLLRKTASSKLDDHAEFGRFAIYWLGQAPKTVAAKHYVKPSVVQFDRAVEWLGQEFGFLPRPEAPDQAR